MDIKDFFSLQENFDQSHFPNFTGKGGSKEKQIQTAIYLVLGALGELGELANVVKKALRGDHPLEYFSNDFKEEIADVFIYLIKICQTLNVDLEEAFLKKLSINEERFEMVPPPKKP
ncbi:MAG: nucleotide pyrophosphohydrolase [Magnetococcales bacterium]|nr:nucleotide pyrophosphohydrolase [Magnetococcales bacterium]